MNFAYRAFKSDGTVVEGDIAAPSRAEAERMLRANGLFPESLDAQTARKHSGSRLAGVLRMGRLRWLTSFTRQMTVLTASGTPVVDALEAVERQTADDHWRGIVADVRQRVEQGESLGDAMGRHPQVFDAVYRSLVSAGESGGDMQQILERIAALTRQQMVTKNAVTGAMVYPALLLVVSSGVLVGLIVQVLPRFEELFETLNAPLPPMTAALMRVSSLIRGHWLEIAVGLAVGIASLWFYLRSPSGVAFRHRFVVRAPMFGPTVRSFKVAQLVRIMGVLLHARVPLLETLAIARQGAGNMLYADLIERASSRVERGETMSDAFRGSDLVPSSVAEAIRNGEQSGRMGEVLVVLADMMDEDNSILVRSLTSVLEPLILTVLGVLVGGVALSLFLPLFDLTASTGAG
ncbi:MAG: type II secretion system F family protein [Phycisphaerales bacterium]